MKKIRMRIGKGRDKRWNRQGAGAEQLWYRMKQKGTEGGTVCKI